MIVIKIENLSVGMEIKNYEELCNILGVYCVNGAFRNNKIEQFKEYFNYIEDDCWITITEVYGLLNMDTGYQIAIDSLIENGITVI